MFFQHTSLCIAPPSSYISFNYDRFPPVKFQKYVKGNKRKPNSLPVQIWLRYLASDLFWHCTPWSWIIHQCCSIHKTKSKITADYKSNHFWINDFQTSRWLEEFVCIQKAHLLSYKFNSNLQLTCEKLKKKKMPFQKKQENNSWPSLKG